MAGEGEGGGRREIGSVAAWASAARADAAHIAVADLVALFANAILRCLQVLCAADLPGSAWRGDADV